MKSRWSTTFSRIENLWPRDGSCPLPLRSKRFISKYFRIVKTQKISKRSLLMYGSHRLLRTKFLPLFVQRRWLKAGIPFGRLMKFSRCVSRKEKYRPSSAAMDFVGVNRRQNESGVLRGGEFFRDNPRRGSVQNEHDHILWKGSNQSTRAVGFTRKIPRHVECVKRVLKNLLK